MILKENKIFRKMFIVTEFAALRFTKLVKCIPDFSFLTVKH